jgi:hypothetical protein
MIDGFDHVGTDHVCNVCSCDYTDDEGGIQGYLGILPVSFCPTCYAGIVDMVEQLDEREWEGLTDDERLQILLTTPPSFLAHKGDIRDTAMTFAELVQKATEAKLMEKNGYEI